MDNIYKEIATFLQIAAICKLAVDSGRISIAKHTVNRSAAILEEKAHDLWRNMGNRDIPTYEIMEQLCPEFDVFKALQK